MKEKTFTLTKAIRFKDGKPIEETVTIKESELTQQQLDFLTGELMLKWQDSPKEVQRRFLSKTKYKIRTTIPKKVQKIPVHSKAASKLYIEFLGAFYPNVLKEAIIAKKQ